jgi:DNA-binding transcriptional ArsR family regulator
MTSGNTILEALVEPSRRRLLDAVRDHERSVGDLVGVVGLSQPGVSRHLRILREAGLVSVRLDKQQHFYRAEPLALVGLDTWLAPYRSYWTAQLDSLGQHLEATAPSEEKRDQP